MTSPKQICGLSVEFMEMSDGYVYWEQYQLSFSYFLILFLFELNTLIYGRLLNKRFMSTIALKIGQKVRQFCSQLRNTKKMDANIQQITSFKLKKVKREKIILTCFSK